MIPAEQAREHRAAEGEGRAMGVRIRAVAVVLLCGAVLTGCDGFLVPAGEGEPRPEQSSASPSPSAAAGGAPASGGLARPTAPASGGYSPPAPQDCPAGLRVDMGEIQAALSHRIAVLTLTNCDRKPQKISGRPSVKAYAADGTAVDIEVNVREEGKKADAELTLPPGGVAYSRLDWRPYDGVEKAQALEIAAGPGHHPRGFPLEGDVRMVDAFDVTPWASAPPR
ncbi:DUF4232 domain-containing protein [Streptomyces sp. NPDC004111]|uniref:DUF4232 domain-containing protein n=1 Tax=Streptomyces sp. NPDC004111 TaxID=3364690 RepID=UPI0036A22833